MKRRITLILLLLLSGAIVNVAVAWGVPTVLRNWEAESMFVMLEAALANTDGVGYWETYETDNGGYVMRRGRIPREEPANRSTDGPWFNVQASYASFGSHCTLETGWPRLSLVFALNPSEPVVRKALLALPKPAFPGFIINTLFYALLLWLLFTVPFTARRKIRRKRGQCEKCAYPIGVSPVCTECGAAVPRKVEA